MRFFVLAALVSLLGCGHSQGSGGGGGSATGGGGSTGGGGGGGTSTGGGSSTGGGTGFGGGTGIPCSGLSELGCLARTDCVADLCFECSCTPTYVGCRAPADMPHTCPMLGCAQPVCCQKPGDCVGVNICVAPGQTVCGTCRPGDCTVDGDCSGGQICDTAGCLCGTDKLCQAACTATSCPEGQACQANGHCGPKSCSDSSQCPRAFSCEADAGTCARMPCSTPLDCPKATYCVEGACSVGEGTCEAPPP